MPAIHSRVVVSVWNERSLASAEIFDDLTSIGTHTLFCYLRELTRDCRIVDGLVQFNLSSALIRFPVDTIIADCPSRSACLGESNFVSLPRPGLVEQVMSSLATAGSGLVLSCVATAKVRIILSFCLVSHVVRSFIFF